MIDFDKHFSPNKDLDIDKIAGRILWRKNDFTTGVIVICILVFDGKSIEITKEDLDKERLTALIEGLNPPRGRV